MTCHIYDRRNRLIYKGRNLSAITRHARRFRSCDIHTLTQHDRMLRVYFAGGDYCETEFASAAVLSLWIDNRVRYGRGRWADGNLKNDLHDEQEHNYNIGISAGLHR